MASRLKFINTTGSGLLLCILLCGCATDAQRTRTQGTTAGAVLGALIGAAITGDASGAAAGAALGGGAGALVGNQVALKKERYAKREDALRASAAKAQQLAQQTRAQNEQLTVDVARLERTIQDLRTRKISAQERRQQTLNSQRELAALLNGVEQRLPQVRAEIARQQVVMEAEAQIARDTREPSPEDGMRLVASSLRDLEMGARALERARAQLQLIDSKRAY